MRAFVAFFHPLIWKEETKHALCSMKNLDFFFLDLLLLLSSVCVRFLVTSLLGQFMDLGHSFHLRWDLQWRDGALNIMNLHTDLLDYMVGCEPCNRLLQCTVLGAAPFPTNQIWRTWHGLPPSARRRICLALLKIERGSRRQLQLSVKGDPNFAFWTNLPRIWPCMQLTWSYFYCVEASFECRSRC